MVLLVAVAAAGCGGGQAAPAYTEADGRLIAPEPQDPEPNHGTPGVQDATGGKIDVPIRDRRFTQPRMIVTVGQIVVFTDDDDVPHTVRNVAGGLPHSGLIPIGGRFELTPLKPGTVRYRCVIHPGMRGVLVVSPARSAGP